MSKLHDDLGNPIDVECPLHVPELDCGCWLGSDGRVHRHAFRFFEGDRVRHSRFGGFVGTVQSTGTLGVYIDWDKIPGLGSATPSASQDSWDIIHLDDTAWCDDCDRYRLVTHKHEESA